MLLFLPSGENWVLELSVELAMAKTFMTQRGAHSSQDVYSQSPPGNCQVEV